MRLIDADALIQKRNHAKAYAQDMYVIGQGYVMDAPTIDAAPVVRGEWIEAKSGGMSVWPDGQGMCSVCKQRMPLAWKKMQPYCYGCGAKMEVEHETD